MANPSGRKGYFGESAVLQYLKRAGFRYVYRLKHQGSRDKGDIGNIEDVCIEVKNRDRYEIAEWMGELAVEKKNAGAKTGAVVMKPRGIGDSRVGEWWAVLTFKDYVQLLIDAKYGPHIEEHEDDLPVQEPGDGRLR